MQSKNYFFLPFLLLFCGCVFQHSGPEPTTRVRAEDGMEMVLIADQISVNPEKMQEVPPFWIDKYEVTNQQYERCADLGHCPEPGFVNSFSRDSYYGNEQFAHYPVIYVEWDQARLYCESVNARLPVVEEWVKAAGGQSDKGSYPWGAKIPSEKMANFNQQAGDTVAVGSYAVGASPYGIFDMAGNVWEWIDSFRGKNPDCCGFNPLDENQIIHGGSWRSDAESLLNENHIYKHYQTSGDDVGFRCVMDVED
jgi:formylglycine-generating enzyme required for sulfatase activity